MQHFITYLQHLEAGDVLSWAGALSLFGFGLWAAAQIIISAVQLYADMAGQRAKERE